MTSQITLEFLQVLTTKERSETDKLARDRLLGCVNLASSCLWLLAWNRRSKFYTGAEIMMGTIWEHTDNQTLTRPRYIGIMT